MDRLKAALLTLGILALPVALGFWLPWGYRGSPEVRHDLHRYMTFRSESLQSGVFTEREVVHLADVRAIVGTLTTVTLAALLVSISLSLTARPRRVSMLRWAGTSSLGLGVLGAAAAWLAPDALLWKLHELLFRNDFWQLDPTRHLLIRLYPPEYWGRALGGYVVAVVALGVASLWASTRGASPSPAAPRRA